MDTVGAARPTENPTPGYLLWRLATRLRTDVDRALAPLGLTHAQYTVLASLYGFARTGARPSQRELADWTGLEPVFMSKLARALERSGLIERAGHPADARAVQLHLTDRGADVARRAIAIVQALQEEFTAPIGGIQSQRTRDLVRTLQTLLGIEEGSDAMTTPATLTGQDVGEAEGALTALLNQLLAGTNTGITRTQYIALRVLALRGPAQSPAALHAYLAGQPQLGLDRAQVGDLLHGLEAGGLIAGSAPDGPGPTQLTAAGAALHARLAEAVTAVTRRLYAALDPGDLATAHRVLAEVTARATRLRDER
ncbi:MAG TPA: MarR family transcriptional regulator [Thermomicrobiales bacterium]|nr:MarR family transcriptional regulator [Thermomicrobiales bacterium]